MTQQMESSLPVKCNNHLFECRCYTKDKKVRGRFVWKINDFTQITEKLTSSVFPTPAPNKTEWTLELCPNRKDESSKTYVSLHIILESTNETWAKVVFSIINDKNNITHRRVLEYIEYSDTSCEGFNDFVKCDYLLNKANGLLPNDELTIACEIEIIFSTENLIKEFVQVNYERPSFRMAKDVGNLLSSKSLTDVTIKVGEVKFEAHKVILAARSPVFAAMFRNEMTEKKYGVVEITDIDPGVFQELLEYIYTDNEISQIKNVKELLAAANKYELDGLKVMCEESLCKTISVDNVLENITLAEIYNCSLLKDYAVRFVLNHNSDVIASSDWETFKSSHLSLVREIFETLCFFK